MTYPRKRLFWGQVESALRTMEGKGIGAKESHPKFLRLLFLCPLLCRFALVFILESLSA